MSSSDQPPFAGPRPCPRCQHLNVSEMVFCDACGTPLDRIPPTGQVPGSSISSSSPPVAGQKSTFPFRGIGWALVVASALFASYYYLAYDIYVSDGGSQRIVHHGNVADRQAGLTYSLLLGFFGVAALFYEKREG